MGARSAAGKLVFQRWRRRGRGRAVASNAASSTSLSLYAAKSSTGRRSKTGTVLSGSRSARVSWRRAIWRVSRLWGDPSSGPTHGPSRWLPTATYAPSRRLLPARCPPPIDAPSSWWVSAAATAAAATATAAAAADVPATDAAKAPTGMVLALSDHCAVCFKTLMGCDHA